MKVIRINLASMFYEKNRELKSKSVVEECINMFYCENRQMFVECGLKYNKIQYISKMKRGHYHY